MTRTNANQLSVSNHKTERHA